MKILFGFDLAIVILANCGIKVNKKDAAPSRERHRRIYRSPLSRQTNFTLSLRL